MANDIKVPGFVNYTDCRPQEECLPTIEVESIKAYAKNLSKEGMEVFLAEVDDFALIVEINNRLDVRKRRLEDAEKALAGWR